MSMERTGIITLLVCCKSLSLIHRSSSLCVCVHISCAFQFNSILNHPTTNLFARSILIADISSLCANALQSSSSFPETPRHNIAQRYLDEGHPYTNGFHFDEGHPYTYNPIKGSDMGLSHAMRRNRPADDGIERGFQDASDSNYGSNTFSESNNGYSMQPEDSENQLQYEPQFSNQNFAIEEEALDEIPQQQQKSRSTLRRKSKLVPRQMSSSILRKSRSKSKNQEAVIESSALLTFEEEKQIAEDIRCFRSVTRTRDDMVEWMSRETGYQNQRRTEPSEYQWASACSLTVDQLHEVLSRGQEARTRLIQGNVGLVTMIAKRYYNMLNGGMGPSVGGAGGGTDATLKLDDLVQEGYMGIMEAAERFDPTKGNRFSTYGTHWIRQRILRSIAESSRTIRLPVHVQTNIRNMHKLSKQLEMTNGRRPSTPELAHEMDVPLDKIHLYQHLSKNVLSLELPVDRHSNTDDKRTIGDRVACTEVATPDEDFLSESLRGEVHSMLESLGHVERLVLTHRFGLDDGIVKSLRETAEGMGVSSDTVRNVEAKALNKLRQPGVNYRLKDYCSPDVLSDGYQYYEQPQYHNGWTTENNYVEEYNQEHPEEEQYHQQEQQHYYHYPHHMNHAPRIKTSDNNMSDDDQGDYDRPTPESIWSF